LINGRTFYVILPATASSFLYYSDTSIIVEWIKFYNVKIEIIDRLSLFNSNLLIIISIKYNELNNLLLLFEYFVRQLLLFVTNYPLINGK
jgi:hypothetical protein